MHHMTVAVVSEALEPAVSGMLLYDLLTVVAVTSHVPVSACWCYCYLGFDYCSHHQIRNCLSNSDCTTVLFYRIQVPAQTRH